jgi:hypothetical protein
MDCDDVSIGRRRSYWSGAVLAVQLREAVPDRATDLSSTSVSD